MTALGHALRWLENRAARMPRLAAHVAGVPGCRACPAMPGLFGAPGLGPGGRPGEPWSEAAARDLLARSGVPVVPGELVNSADEAAAAARRLGLPVVLKVCSAQITHKSDIGGVAVGPGTEEEVRAAYARVRAAGEAVPGARIDGVLVSPMRTGGVELIAGVTVDPTFGPVLAVGLGGVWVEVLGDTSLRVLPVDPGEVQRMLAELRGSPLLTGGARRPAGRPRRAGRGRSACSATRPRSASTGSLRALEVNPLWADGDRIEALDVLCHRVRRTVGQEQIGAGTMKLAVSTEQQELGDVGAAVPGRPGAGVPGPRADGDRRTGSTGQVWQQAGAQLGLQGIAIPEEYGGAGFSFAEQAIVLEELGAALYGGPYLASAVLAATALLSGFG